MIEIILVLIMAIWALINWTMEGYGIIDSFQTDGIFSSETIKKVFILIGDLMLTGIIVSTFPLVGMLGAIVGLFMSNWLSVALRIKIL